MALSGIFNPGNPATERTAYFGRVHCSSDIVMSGMTTDTLRIGDEATSDDSMLKLSSSTTSDIEYIKVISSVPSTSPDTLFLVTGEASAGSLKGVLYLGDAFQNQSDSNYSVKIDSSGNSFIDSGNNSYLGIGTQTPLAKLHLHRTDGSSTSFMLSNTSNTSGVDILCNSSGGMDITNRQTGSNSYVRFQTNGSTERMRISNAGNVGIGTTSPTTPLDVVGNIRSTGQIYSGTPTSIPTGTGVAVQNTGSQAVAYLQNSTAQGSIVVRDSTNPSYVGTSSAHKFSLVANNSIGLTQDTVGNIGIGTTAPTTKLDVNGITKTAGLQSTNSIYTLSNNLSFEPPSATGSRNIILCQGSSSGSSPIDKVFRYRCGGGGSREGWTGHVYSYYDNPNYLVTTTSAGLQTRLFTSLTDLNDPAVLGTVLTTLSPSGNLGIGVSSPTYKLDVSDSSRFGNLLTTGEIYSTGAVNAESSVSIGGKLSYSTNSLYTELTGSSYTATRTLADYTPGMTDTFNYAPPSSGLPTYNLTYKVSRQMIETGGELNVCLTVYGTTFAGNIDITVQTYNEVGGALEGLNLDTTVTPMVKTSSQLISGNYLFEYIKLVFMANNGSGDPCVVVKRLATN